MKKAVKRVSITFHSLFSRKKTQKVSDQERLRQSARATLKKYHTTFRRLAHE